MELSGKSAIITGGNSGFGRATAEEFLAAGARVTIIDRDEETGQALAEKLGISFAHIDITDEEEVVEGLSNIADNSGGISVCVNCAGIAVGARIFGHDGPHDYEIFRKTVDVNLSGTFNVVRIAAAIMAQNAPNEDGERGVIVNVSSIAASEGQSGQSAYAAAKSGIVGMTLPLARDLGSTGIRVNTIAPGIFDTRMLKKLRPRLRRKLASNVIFPRRLGVPSEFAKLAKFLVECAYINGETVRIDGALRLGHKH